MNLGIKASQLNLEQIDLFSEVLLAHIEKEGMLPPTIKNPKLPKDMDVWTHATERAIDELYQRRNPIEPFEVNEWENEDET